ncbi:hypothetical protein DSB72_14330, partial [Salmonella enterica subsp. enterica serovar Typhimurium]
GNEHYSPPDFCMPTDTERANKNDQTRQISPPVISPAAGDISHDLMTKLFCTLCARFPGGGAGAPCPGYQPQTAANP